MSMIDADAMMNHMKNLFCGNCDTPRKRGWCDVCDYEFFMNEMKKVPTVDAVEVVRCKDCKYGQRLIDANDLHYFMCSSRFGHGRMVRNNNFCAWGERREDVKND